MPHYTATGVYYSYQFYLRANQLGQRNPSYYYKQNKIIRLCLITILLVRAACLYLRVHNVRVPTRAVRHNFTKR